MYLRGLEYHDYLTKPQKSQIQAILLTLFKKKDFSDKKFSEITERSNMIFSAPYINKIEKAVRESQKLLTDFQLLTQKRQGDIKSLECNSVAQIESGKDPSEVITGIRAAFKTLITRMDEDQARLSMLSMTDDLTGLNNRRAFDEFLVNSISIAKENNTTLSMIMLDIDHFKKFNDDYGHRVGDQALAAVGKIIKACSEKYRTEKNKPIFEARYGGEEFSIVLPGAVLIESASYAEIVRGALESYNFLIRNTAGDIVKTKISITASLGVAELPIDNLPPSPLESLVEAADQALYKAKEAGRNTVCRSQM